MGRGAEVKGKISGDECHVALVSEEVNNIIKPNKYLRLN